MVENGLRDPIILFQNKILDGRNRYNICKSKKIAARFTQFGGTDLEARKFAFDVNYNRRHLTDSQRACVAAEYMQLTKMSQADKGRRSNEIRWHGASKISLKGDHFKVVAAKYKVGQGRLKSANTLLIHDKDLFQTVKNGEAVLREAYRNYRKKIGPKCRVGKWIQKETSGNLEASAKIQVPDLGCSSEGLHNFMNIMVLHGWIGEMKTVILMGNDGKKGIGYQFNWYGNGFMSRYTNWGQYPSESSYANAVLVAAQEKLNETKKKFAPAYEEVIA